MINMKKIVWCSNTFDNYHEINGIIHGMVYDLMDKNERTVEDNNMLVFLEYMVVASNELIKRSQ